MIQLNALSLFQFLKLNTYLQFVTIMDILQVIIKLFLVLKLFMCPQPKTNLPTQINTWFSTTNP
jgi:hypothetical protein